MFYEVDFSCPYADFIRTKHLLVPESGFQCLEAELPANLFDWQKDIVRWAVQKGRAAIFAGCGLGKTAMQLAWAQQIVHRTNRPVLIMAPLAVGTQTVHEAEKFGVTARTVRNMEQVGTGINIINYDMMDHVSPELFAGVVLDESSILKSLNGKTKQRLISMFASTPYRLCCTATPAPNDYMELGNHAEFLGIMSTGEMLARWFIHDSNDVHSWRLKGHAERSFWEWVSTWAVTLNMPSDIGEYSDDGFALPELVTRRHIVHVDIEPQQGMLVYLPDRTSATNIHRNMRLTLKSRVQKAAELVEDRRGEPCIVWCNLNDESDLLRKSIPGSVEIRGSMDIARKEDLLNRFTEGRSNTLISKPSICGWGMNWQHCRNIIFVGCTWSFESRYQAIRRCWRFGQKQTVYDNVIMSEHEMAIFATVQEKERKFLDMAKAMKGLFGKRRLFAQSMPRYARPIPNRPIELPKFIERKAANG